MTTLENFDKNLLEMRKMALRTIARNQYALNYYHEHKEIKQKQKMSKYDKYHNDEEYRKRIQQKNREYHQKNREYGRNYYLKKKAEKAEKVKKLEKLKNGNEYEN